MLSCMSYMVVNLLFTDCIHKLTERNVGLGFLLSIEVLCKKMACILQLAVQTPRRQPLVLKKMCPVEIILQYLQYTILEKKVQVLGHASAGNSQMTVTIALSTSRNPKYKNYSIVLFSKACNTVKIVGYKNILRSCLSFPSQACFFQSFL